MRPQVEWMTRSDDTILEYLQETELALPPRAISFNLTTRENVDISYTTVNRRLKQLLDHGLVKKEYEKGGFYSITDKGRSYLSGSLDSEHLENTTEE